MWEVGTLYHEAGMAQEAITEREAAREDFQASVVAGKATYHEYRGAAAYLQRLRTEDGAAPDR